MEVAQHIEALRREGRLLTAAAASGGLDASIPTCPGWRMRDLLQHMGGIHRWAAAHVQERLTSPIPGYDALVGAWPPDAELVTWVRDGHAQLVRVLEEADPGVQCWSFLPAPSPLAFWARRQAHETGIHRADAEGASGAISGYEPAVAADGLDELLLAFLPRPRTKLRADPPRALHVHATDVHGEWLIRINPDSVQVLTEHAEADCSVHGAASDLYLLLWNRRTLDGLEVSGDRALLDLWRELVQVRWS